MARSALLCWSMHHLQLEAAEPYIFGPYFLVPFLLAVAVLLLEIGLVERQPTIVRLALALPALLVVLAAVGHRPEPTYQAFLAEFSARLGGTPLFLTLVAAAGYYAYAWTRRASLAAFALTLALLGLAVVDPSTRDLGRLAAPRFLPMAVVSGLLFAIAVIRRDRWFCLLAVGCLVAATLTGRIGGAPLPYRLPLGYHVALFALLALGAVCEDALGRWCRNYGALLALLGCIALLVRPDGGMEDQVPPLARWIYPPVMCLVLAAYGWLLKHRGSLAAAGAILTCWALWSGWLAYRYLRVLVAGLDYIALGMASLALAWLTSLSKGASSPPGRTRARTNSVLCERARVDPGVVARLRNRRTGRSATASVPARALDCHHGRFSPAPAVMNQGSTSPGLAHPARTAPRSLARTG